MVNDVISTAEVKQCTRWKMFMNRKNLKGNGSGILEGTVPEFACKD
jgi:hypothetical protein